MRLFYNLRTLPQSNNAVLYSLFKPPKAIHLSHEALDMATDGFMLLLVWLASFWLQAKAVTSLGGPQYPTAQFLPFDFHVWLDHLARPRYPTAQTLPATPWHQQNIIYLFDTLYMK